MLAIYRRYRPSRQAVLQCLVTGADPGINYEGQEGGAQEYEYNYEGRGGAQEYEYNYEGRGGCTRV